ncbi:FimB/Mfa2 family fimbrial subunit [Phocaeicola barnesiae]
MNKKFILGITLLGALSFYSCSNETVIDSETGQEVGNNEQVLSLTILNSGEGLTSRAGRPMYGTEAKQTIDKVRLWICDSGGKVVYIKDYSDWLSDSESYDNGRMTNFVLENRLTAGTYTVYAIGYDSNSDYDLSVFTRLAKESTYSPNTIISKTSDGGETVHGEEFFAGSLDFTLSDSKGFKKDVVLNRQVAGAYIYVKDIPFMNGNSRYIRLVASAKNNELVFGNFANIDIASNGGAGTAAKFVVNGTNTDEGEYEICKIDLQNWFYSISDENNDGLIDATVESDPSGCQYPGKQGNNWKNPYKIKAGNTSTDYPTFRRGSVFGGEFIIPFAKVAGEQTLKLQLLDSSSQELLSWNINLSNSDQQVGKTVTYWNNSSWGSFTSKDDKNSYSLVRNHVYGIGDRTMDNPGWNPDPEKPGTDPEPPVDPIDPTDPSDPDPDKPTDPDPDPTNPTDPDNPNPNPDVDDPESLDNKQYLTVKVNDNWEIIHDMELE